MSATKLHTHMQAREKLLQQIIESTDCIKEIVKSISTATNSFSDRQHCAYRMLEGILNSNHTDINKN
jgi:hypothetical protein